MRRWMRATRSSCGPATPGVQRSGIRRGLYAASASGSGRAWSTTSVFVGRVSDDVQVPEALLAVGDERGLDHDHVIELEALRLARRQERNALVGVDVGQRGLGELVRDDQRDEALLARQARGLAVGLLEQLVCRHAPDVGRGGAGPVGERPLDVRRDVVEQRQRELHDLARDAVGMTELLDLGLVAARQVAQDVLPAPVHDRPVPCATSPSAVSDPSRARRATMRSCIGVRSWASSTITWP